VAAVLEPEQAAAQAAQAVERVARYRRRRRIPPILAPLPLQQKNVPASHHPLPSGGDESCRSLGFKTGEGAKPFGLNHALFFIFGLLLEQIEQLLRLNLRAIAANKAAVRTLRPMA
jgi:hypothetical protein